MENEVLNALIDVFNSANYQFLTLLEITQRLKRRGFYRSLKDHKAAAKVLDDLCRYPLANHLYSFERGEDDLWGLKRWFPQKQHRHLRSRVQTVEPLRVGREVQHTLTTNGSEVDKGIFPLRGQNYKRFFASMDEKQRQNLFVELRCYGTDRFVCAIVQDNRRNWFLEGMALQHWYSENALQPGDKVCLVVESIAPLYLRIYTEWDRDADAFRRYEQRRNIENLPSIDLPTRDLLWLYFKQKEKIAHRSEIQKAILTDRPEISSRSIDACLGMNSHLFVRVGEGNWGLKEWGIEQVTMIERPKGSYPEAATDENLPTVSVPLDYILANIAAEDLVYQVLQNTETSLSNSQITDRISKYLGINRGILARSSYFDPYDSRLIRLQDGTFTIRENLEDVISELTSKERELRQSLIKINHEIDSIKDEFASIFAQQEIKIMRIKGERDKWYMKYLRLTERHSGEFIILETVLSKFMVVLIHYLGRSTFQLVFDDLRRELKSSRDGEEVQ